MNDSLDQLMASNLFTKYRGFISEITQMYSYPKNIAHLLTIIIPTFIFKYGLKYEAMILECFKNIPIIISNEPNDTVTAYYYNALKYKSKNDYYIEHAIVLNTSDETSLIEHIDNIIHEYNHAINAYNKSIIKKDSYLINRSGLSLTYYQMDDIVRREHVAFEEVINTKQTEEMVNLLISLAALTVGDYEIDTALHTIKSEFANKQYKSASYLNLSYVSKDLLSNKSFMPTIEELRLKGQIDEIINWFDSLAKPGAFEQLSTNMDELLEIIINNNKRKMNFLQRRKLKKKANDIKYIINLFNGNCLYR